MRHKFRSDLKLDNNSNQLKSLIDSSPDCMYVKFSNRSLNLLSKYTRCIRLTSDVNSFLVMQFVNHVMSMLLGICRCIDFH